jgi:replicative DNA helicase
MEQAVLGSVLVENRAMHAAMTTLKGVEFYRGAHAAIWKCMVRLWSRGEAIDLLTLQQELKRREQLDDVGGAPYLVGLLDAVGSAANVGWYAAQVAEAWRRRMLLRHAGLTEQLAHDDAKEMPEVLKGVQDSLDEACSGSARVQEAPTVTQTAERIIAERGTSPRIELGTSISSLDRWTLGLHRSEFLVLGGPTGGGKSCLALQIARRVAERDGGVLFFSLEMSPAQIHERLLSAVAQVDLHRIRARTIEQCEADALQEASERMDRIPLRFCYDRDVSVPSVRAHSRMTKTAPTLVVVDYLHLLVQDEEQYIAELGRITRDLKLLALEMDVAVMALAQYNRAFDYQRGTEAPAAHNFRGSKQIEANADCMWALSYAQKPEPGDHAKRAVPVLLDICKQRMGPTFMRVSLLFDGRYQRFYDQAPEGLTPPHGGGSTDDGTDPFS